MDRLLLICVAALMAFATHAQVITPGQNLGKLELLLTEKRFHDSYQKFVLIYTSKSGLKTRITEFNKAYTVPRGKGCLKLSAYPKHQTAKLYSWINCDIEINKKKTTSINLGLSHLVWNQDAVAVDIGPKLSFSLSSPSLEGLKSFDFDMNNHMSQNMILPTGNRISLSYSHFIPTKKNVLSFNTTGEATIDITPIVQRSKIVISRTKKIFDSPKYLQRYSGNTKMIHYRRVNAHTRTAESVLHTQHLYTKQRIENKNIIKSNFLNVRKDEHILYAYAVDQSQKSYELIVNNIPVALILKPGEENEVILESLNVGLLDGQYEGEYQLRQFDSRIPEGERTLQYAITCIDRENPCAKLSKGLYFKTESSIEVPRGFLYELSAFMKLDNDSREIQDKIEIDLR